MLELDDTVTAPVRRHKLDVATYNGMNDAGLFGPDDRVELIEGELIDMAPIGQDHASTVNELAETLILACAGAAYVSVQNPIAVDNYNEPQPDLAICRARPDRYRKTRPGPADVLVLIEVADSTLRFDRTVKLRVYARAGVAEFWLVDLKRRVLEVYRLPVGDQYTAMTTHGAQDTLSLSLAPTIQVSLAQVFG